MEDKDKLPRSQRFVDIDNDVDIEMDLSEDLIRIRDSRDIRSNNQEDHGGFVVLPTKIPLGVLVVFVVQCVLTAVSLTSIYVEQKTTTAIQNEKIAQLETSSYSKIDAMYLTKEVDVLKNKVERLSEINR